MSFFLNDTPEDKKRRKSELTGKTNFVTGGPIYEKKRPQDNSMREMYNSGREIYHMGKSVYKTIKNRNVPHEPKDYDETIKMAAHLKKMEKKAKLYRQAKEDIDEYHTRRQEYEKEHPRSFMDRLRGR